MPDRLIGREAEIGACERFLEAVADGPAALMVEGEPGIGKTALVGHTVEVARARDYEVLAARPTKAESSLSFVVLTDLFSDAHELFAELPPPQHIALEVALLLNEPSRGPPDPRAIGVGALGVLRALAASRPVLVAIDDLQWLDAPSAAALSFALRRVADERIGLLVAIRKDEHGHAFELDHSLPSERVVPGPLSLGAIYVLLAARLRLSVPRSVLVRIHDTCRGNPLFALEIARALKERGLPEPGQPFEIPSDAEALFAMRLDQLSGDTLDALAVAATTASPTRSLLSRTHASALEPAVHAGIIRLEGERIYFTHPLLASAAYARLDSAARRKLHRSIAAAVTDPEERARHLALAADAPDGEVSTALDKAAEQAAARGAYAAAAELAELAVKLMPPDDANHLLRKRLAAHHHFFAGDIARAREILETLIGELPPGVERARALLQLAEARSGEVVAMLSLREQAALEAVGDDLTLAVAHRWLSQTLFVSGDPGRALDHARRALAAAERSGDTRATALSLAYVVWLELWNDRVTPGLLERALALEEGAGYLRVYESPSVVEAIRLMVLEDDLDGSRERLSAAESIARDHGDDESRALLLIHLAMVEYRAGRIDHAVRYATESIDLREQFGFSPGAHLYVLALAEAARGRIGTARAAAERGRELCEQVGNELYAVSNLRALGFLALSTGDWPVAAQILAPLPERLAARGYGRVTVLQVLPDAIEALIAVGEVGRAATQLRDLDETARLGITYAHARAARCRGLLAAAERDYAAALEAFEDALSAHEELPDPLERGRTLLALGQVRRRLKQKRLAKEALEDALAIFEQTGAVVWAGRARVELERIGLRRRAPDELTETEQQVAELAAAGLKNREIAAQAFLTPKSVEDVLQRVYRKLDIHSRAELGAQMATTAGRR